MDLGRRCIRFKRTQGGKRCAEFSDGVGDVGDVGDYDGLADFGDPEGVSAIAGPLIGGGVAQVVTTAVKLIGKDKKIAKWAAGIGLLVGGGLSAVLAFRRATRATGISGLITAGIVTLPRQLEDMLSKGTMAGAERELYGEDETAGEDVIEGEEMDGAPPLQLLDSGGGSTGVFGAIVPEQEMGAIVPEQEKGADETDGAQQDMTLLGAFGTNFMAVQ